jgi:GGDEF domain-containing protein
VLREVAESFPGSFLGHVGGDDFVMVVGTDDAEAASQKAIELFDSGVAALYHPEDAERGYVMVEDRRGRLMRYPILTLSVGVGLNEEGIRDYREIVDAATEMKSFAKRQAGSVYAIDRRSHTHD